MHAVRYDKRGFTLIELLVVMAVAAVFLGVLGVAISGGGGTVATESAQRSLTTMISAARSQAVLNQARTRLIIHADPPTAGDMSDPRREKYLRFMAILVDGPNGWEEINDGSYLPKGIYVVPPFDLNPPAPAAPANVISASASDWAHERRTIVGLDTMQWAYAYTGGGTPPPSALHHYIYIEFTPKGTTNTTTVIGTNQYERRIVVAPATTTGILPRFETNTDSDVLGGMIRRNGSITVVNNPEGLPDPL